MEMVICENGGTLVIDINSNTCRCTTGYVGDHCKIGNSYLNVLVKLRLEHVRCNTNALYS